MKILSFLCLSVLISHTLYAQSPDFELPITLTDGDYVIDMKIGMDAGATNGFDRLIDVLAAPAPPLDDVFDGFIQGNDNLWWDIRSNASDTASFVVELIPRTDNGPVTVSWDPTGLAALGSFWIEERSPLQGNFYLDMTTSSQFVTTGPPDLSYGFMIKVDLGGGSPITIPAIADAFVRGGNAYKTINYGTSDTLHVQDNGGAAGQRETYLKFDLSSITDSVTSASLKLYPFEVAGSGPIEHALWFVSDDSWTESGLIWNNKPSASPQIDTWSPVQDVVTSVDVTSYVETVRTTGGDSLLSLKVISNTISNSDWALYASKEHPNGFAPILEITTTATGGDPTNQPPSVSITQPTDGATFTEGDAITLEASASDTDGTITKVEYFSGSTLLGEGTGANYSLTWNSAGVGSHALTAVATDDDNATTTSSVVNITVNAAGGGPVTVTTIADAFVRGGNAYKTINYGTSDTLHVQDNGGASGQRETYLKFDLSSLTDSVTTATLKLYPFEVAGSGPIEHALWFVSDDSWTELGLIWNNKPAATPQISTWSPVQGAATSTDVTSYVETVRTTAGDSLLSLKVISNTISNSDWALYSSKEHPNGFAPILEITTTATGGGPSNQPPSVSITQPTDGATFTEGTAITLEASASDSDGTITKVEYFAGSTLLGEGTGANYSFTWNGAGVGSHALTAVATDDDNATTTSGVVNITVNASGGDPVTVTAIADAFVRGGNAYKTVNYGTSDTLHVQDNGGNTGRRETYLKFDLSSITDSVTTATLKLYPFEVTGSGPIEHALWFVSDDSWTESGLIWNNKPAASPQIDTWSPVQGAVVSADVTSYVETVRTTSGDSLLSLKVISNTISNSDWALYASKEHPNGFAPIIEITTSSGSSKGVQGTATDDANETPERFTLHGNYPNPFNPSTTISFDLSEEAIVHIEIYDLMGRQVMSTPEQRMASGPDARISIEASSLASGVYIYRVIAVMAQRSAIETGRMTLVK